MAAPNQSEGNYCVLDVTRVTVEVVDPQSHGSGLHKYVDYEVRVNTTLPQFQGKPCTVRRRYRDFAWLHESLDNEEYAPGSVQRPALPEKHSFGNMDSDYDNTRAVNERRLALQHFLHAVIGQAGYLASPSLAIFLTADEGKFATAQIDEDSFTRYMNMPIKYSLEAEINKATYTLLNLTENNAIEGDDSVPLDLLCGCAGIAFLTVAKGGFFFSGRAGTGLVVARLPDGSWSAPSGIGAAGAGWGFQLGAEVTDMMIILNEPEAVQAFCSSAQMSMGTELSMSFGPVGRSAETTLTAGDGGTSTAFSYAHSRGLFVGVSLQAAVVVARPDVNRVFYNGSRHTPQELLTGQVPPPAKAEPLYRALRKVERQPAVAASLFYNAPEPEFEWDGTPKPPPPHLSTHDRLRQRAEQEEADRRLALAMQAEEEAAAGFHHGQVPRPQAQAQPPSLWRVSREEAEHTVGRQMPPPAVAQSQERERPQQASMFGDYGDLFGAASTTQQQPEEDDQWAQERRRRLSSQHEDEAAAQDVREMGVMLNPPPPPGEDEEVTTEGGFVTRAAPSLASNSAAFEARPLTASATDLFGEEVTPLSADQPCDALSGAEVEPLDGEEGTTLLL